MFWAARAVLCETGRGAARRATEVRLLTERRRPGRPSGLGATFFGAAILLAEAAFFGAALATRRTGFFALAATLRLAGRFDLPLLFTVLRLAMIASVCLLRWRHSLTGRRAYSSLISRSFSSLAK